MKQNHPSNTQAGEPGFSRFAFNDLDNRRRQALQAALFAQYSHLEAHLAEHPASAPAVAMAGELLEFLRQYVQGTDSLQAVIDLEDWWAVYQGPSRAFVDFLNAKIDALNLLTALFATLKGLGLSVVHEHPKP